MSEARAPSHLPHLDPKLCNGHGTTFVYHLYRTQSFPRNANRRAGKKRPSKVLGMLVLTTTRPPQGRPDGRAALHFSAVRVGIMH